MGRYPPGWEAISRAIRKAAHERCEMCGVANGATVARKEGKETRIILTVHHIGIPYAGEEVGDPHDKMDVRPANLIALCQLHHLAADEEIRRLTRRWEEQGFKDVAARLGGIGGLPWGTQARYDRGTLYNELRMLALMRQRVLGSLAPTEYLLDGRAIASGLRRIRGKSSSPS